VTTSLSPNDFATVDTEKEALASPVDARGVARATASTSSRIRARARVVEW
jgi:hypothetical protein